MKSSDKLEEIPSLSHQPQGVYFYFRHLKFELIDNECLPVGLHYLDEMEDYLSSQHLERGLTVEQVAEREQLYGRN